MRIVGCISKENFSAVEKLNPIAHEEIRFIPRKISFALETVHATNSKFYQISTFSTMQRNRSTIITPNGKLEMCNID